MYAKVEAVEIGLATVRLAESGTRLTNLSIIGGEINVGETVIIDYSSGTPPVVRPYTILDTLEEVLPLAADLPERAIEPDIEDEIDLVFVGGEHGVRVHQLGGTPTHCPKNQWVEVRWGSMKWDTDDFFLFTNPYRITIPAPGYYLCIADIGWDPCGPFNDAHDNMPHIEAGPGMNVEIYSNVFGVVATNRDNPIDCEPTVGKIMNVVGYGHFERYETVKVRVMQEAVSTLNLEQSVWHIYPRLTIQWIGNERDDFQE
jgi:hypothetical protein